ncbi:hypothetical protein CYJ10_16545 [Cupriavidus pauculus]|uniref:Phasin domain-containing protein n=2 Tax=Cupriavidus pauculus TaxID=82633 RepID=A0A2N5CBI0_9BURK|nr:hypothetical protein CYJ10_16545 [Cupriavidus pauculus]
MLDLFRATICVVSHRTHRMAMAGPAPTARDQHEFSLMGIEKGEAATESLLAMTSGWLALTATLASDTSEHLLATSAAAAMLASSRSPSQALEHQAALWTLAAQNPVNALQLTRLSTRLMQEILAPIHGRAMANAKRLAIQ